MRLWRTVVSLVVGEKFGRVEQKVVRRLMFEGLRASWIYTSLRSGIGRKITQGLMGRKI